MVIIRLPSRNTTQWFLQKNKSVNSIGSASIFKGAIAGGETDSVLSIVFDSAQQIIPVAMGWDSMKVFFTGSDLDGVTTCHLSFTGVLGNLLVTIPALTAGLFEDLVNRDTNTENEEVCWLFDTLASAAGAADEHSLAVRGSF